MCATTSTAQPITSLQTHTRVFCTPCRLCDAAPIDSHRKCHKTRTEEGETGFESVSLSLHHTLTCFTQREVSLQHFALYRPVKPGVLVRVHDVDEFSRRRHFPRDSFPNREPGETNLVVFDLAKRTRERASPEPEKGVTETCRRVKSNTKTFVYKAPALKSDTLVCPVQVFSDAMPTVLLGRGTPTRWSIPEKPKGRGGGGPP